MSVTRVQPVEVGAFLDPDLVELSCGEGSLKVGIEAMTRDQAFTPRE